NLVEIHASGRVVWKGVFEEFGATAEDHEHIVEVVRDAAGKASEHLHFLRLADLDLQTFLACFERSAMTNVLDNLHDTAQGTVLVVDRSRGNADGNKRAIGAAAFCFMTNDSFSGECSSKNRFMFGAHFRGHNRRLLTERIHGLETENSFGRRIPMLDDALGIESDNGHRRRLNECSKPFATAELVSLTSGSYKRDDIVGSNQEDRSGS